MCWFEPHPLPHALNQTGGRGIDIHDDSTTGTRSSAFVRASLIEQNHSLGVGVLGSYAGMRDVSILDTLAQLVDGRFGDGVLVESWAGAEAEVELSSCHIGRSARAGLLAFGAAASLHAVSLSCNAIHLAAEPSVDSSAVITDAGDNRCSCGEEEQLCMAPAIGLEPPL